MIRSWWDQLLIIYIPSLNVLFVCIGEWTEGGIIYLRNTINKRGGDGRGGIADLGDTAPPPAAITGCTLLGRT